MRYGVNLLSFYCEYILFSFFWNIIYIRRYAQPKLNCDTYFMVNKKLTCSLIWGFPVNQRQTPRKPHQEDDSLSNSFYYSPRLSVQNTMVHWKYIVSTLTTHLFYIFFIFGERETLTMLILYINNYMPDKFGLVWFVFFLFIVCLVKGIDLGRGMYKKTLNNKHRLNESSTLLLNQLW